jgi:LmbE family N-acetylglucosaminyl deacetylase
MLPLTRLERVIVLGAHTDDGEFGCGATMCRLIDAGVEVYYGMFSICEQSVPPGLPRDILMTEAIEASRALGLDENRLILEEMVKMRNEIRPDLVILPSTQDLHQDHATIASEGWRAFKETSMLGYEVSWNNLSFPTHAFSRVTSDHLERKIRAVQAYASQQFRSYAKESFIRSLAEVRGTQIGEPLAEAFEVTRWVM